MALLGLQYHHLAATMHQLLEKQQSSKLQTGLNFKSQIGRSCEIP